MSSFLYPSLTPHYLHFRHKSTQSPPRFCNFQCNARRPTSPPDRDSQSDNAVLKLAWYGSELLGIAASFFRSPPEPRTQDLELDVASADASGPIARDGVVETIKEDFQRSYFVTGMEISIGFIFNSEFGFLFFFFYELSVTVLELGGGNCFLMGLDGILLGSEKLMFVCRLKFG